eukprot:scaffold51850_cov57-Phaeocystis_antarctica.AAC.1
MVERWPPPLASTAAFVRYATTASASLSTTNEGRFNQRTKSALHSDRETLPSGQLNKTISRPRGVPTHAQQRSNAHALAPDGQRLRRGVPRLGPSRAAATAGLPEPTAFRPKRRPTRTAGPRTSAAVLVQRDQCRQYAWPRRLQLGAEGGAPQQARRLARVAGAAQATAAAIASPVLPAGPACCATSPPPHPPPPPPSPPPSPPLPPRPPPRSPPRFPPHSPVNVPPPPPPAARPLPPPLPPA